MRIRGAKTELQDAGLETEGMAESTAKLREEIQALSGVDIMLDDSTFKSTYDILDALSQKWGELSDLSRANITELIAGKRQGWYRSPPIWRHIGKQTAQIGRTPAEDNTKGKARISENPLTTTA